MWPSYGETKVSGQAELIGQSGLSVTRRLPSHCGTGIWSVGRCQQVCRCHDVVDADRRGRCHVWWRHCEPDHRCGVGNRSRTGRHGFHRPGDASCCGVVPRHSRRQHGATPWYGSSPNCRTTSSCHPGGSGCRAVLACRQPYPPLCAKRIVTGRVRRTKPTGKLITATEFCAAASAPTVVPVLGGGSTVPTVSNMMIPECLAVPDRRHGHSW